MNQLIVKLKVVTKDFINLYRIDLIIKKSIMTISYNSSIKSMKKYLAATLVKLDCNLEDTNWYSTSESITKQKINHKDLFLLITTIKYIISNDFEKINKLGKYLRNIAVLLNLLELPITWTLQV